MINSRASRIRNCLFTLKYDTFFHRTIKGSRQYHCMRLVPTESGIMSTEVVQMREYSCPCPNCATGNTCQVPSQNINPWKNCALVRKPVEPTVNIVPAIINPDSDGGEDVDQNPWDFWEPE